MSRPASASRDPQPHIEKVKDSLHALIAHLREDIGKFDEPKAQAMFETTAEVLEGLETAFTHYSEGREAGMRR